MGKKKDRAAPEINAGAMADIAFLLLIFFLVTTTIASDKGLLLQLPPKRDLNAPPPLPIPDHDLFKILINSKDKLLVEDEPADISSLKSDIKKFITNKGRDPKSSTSPKKAIVSLKSDRGTSYRMYISVLDEIKAAYNEVKAEYLGISVEQYLKLERKDPKQKEMLDRANGEFPTNLSEAEPTNSGGGQQ
jgi:biopolymer transport protein ExbD